MRILIKHVTLKRPTQHPIRRPYAMVYYWEIRTDDLSIATHFIRVDRIHKTDLNMPNSRIKKHPWRPEKAELAHREIGRHRRCLSCARAFSFTFDPSGLFVMGGIYVK